MKYFVCEKKFEDYNTKTAGVKARDDIDVILCQEGYSAIYVCPEIGDRTSGSIQKKLMLHRLMGRIWKKQLGVLNSRDILVMQLPVVNNYIFIGSILRNLRKRQVKIVGLIHDLELLRMSSVKEVSCKQKVRMRFEEKSVLNQCDVLIVHNRRMADYLHNIGIKKEKMIILELFDYLCKENLAIKPLLNSRQFIIAGNMSPQKSGYVYQIPSELEVNVYGVNYQKNSKQNLHYKGAFFPEELIQHLSGTFGLVWDGESVDTCTGAYGDYLKYNNPHKTSLYLAAGFPVLIWKNAALSDFIEKENVGFGVQSIEEAGRILTRISEKEYLEILKNVERISCKVRTGCFFKAALKKAELL